MKKPRVVVVAQKTNIAPSFCFFWVFSNNNNIFKGETELAVRPGNG
jgi:hypothetical protein